MLTPQDFRILKKDSIANMSMLGFYAKHNPLKVLRKGDSIFAKGISDEDWWYLSLENQNDFDWFIDQTNEEDRFLAAIEDSVLEKIKKQFTCRWVLSCQRFYLPDEVKLPELKLPVSNLIPTDANHIYNNSNYKTFTTVNYIEEQIKNGPGAAFRDGSTLAGWVLTHDDGALGALHVLDKYRRRGIAKALVVDIIKQVRDLDQIPYTYVELSNNASLELTRNLGFVPDRAIHWVNLNR